MIIKEIFTITAILQFVFAMACTIHNNAITNEALTLNDELKNVKRVKDVSFKQWSFFVFGITWPTMFLCSFFVGAFFYVLAIFLIAMYVRGGLLITIIRTAIILSLFIKIIFFL